MNMTAKEVIELLRAPVREEAVNLWPHQRQYHSDEDFPEVDDGLARLNNLALAKLIEQNEVIIDLLRNMQGRNNGG